MFHLLTQQQCRSRVGDCVLMTNEQKKNIEKVFAINADKQLSLEKVLNTTLKALCVDVMTSVYAKSILGEDRTEERKKFRATFALCMPHYVLNGTNEVVIADFVAANDSNKLSKTVKQYRLSVDSDIVNPEGCLNYIETEKETKKTEIVTLESGYELEVPSRDADGNFITESVKVQLVPRKKAVWGYTKDVMAAIINAMEIIENEK